MCGGLQSGSSGACDSSSPSLHVSSLVSPELPLTDPTEDDGN